MSAVGEDGTALDAAGLYTAMVYTGLALGFGSGKSCKVIWWCKTFLMLFKAIAGGVWLGHDCKFWFQNSSATGVLASPSADGFSVWTLLYALNSILLA